MATNVIALARPPFLPDQSLYISVCNETFTIRNAQKRQTQTHPMGPAKSDPTTSPTWIIETQSDWSELLNA